MVWAETGFSKFWWILRVNFFSKRCRIFSTHLTSMLRVSVMCVYSCSLRRRKNWSHTTRRSKDIMENVKNCPPPTKKPSSDRTVARIGTLPTKSEDFKLSTRYHGSRHFRTINIMKLSTMLGSRIQFQILFLTPFCNIKLYFPMFLRF